MKPQVQDTPCKIYSTVGYGDTEAFYVRDVGAWAHTDQGVYAAGKWATDLDDDAERHVLIPYANVQWIEFDFDALALFEEHETDG